MGNIDWPAVIFTADGLNEPFNETQVVTAKSQLVELALQSAASILISQDNVLHTQQVIDVAKLLIMSKKLYIQEFVQITDRQILVCVDRSFDDEDYIFRTLDLIADALEQLSGAEGKIYYGDQLTFSVDDLEWPSVDVL